MGAVVGPAVMVAALTVLWRRRFPLAATAISMGTFIALDQIARLFDDGPVEVWTSIFVLIHVYALFRWGSGRHCAWGLVILALAFASSQVVAWSGFGDAIGGLIVLLFPAVLGAEVRHLVQRRERDRLEAKAQERESLARELHDTVAHHVSAIAIQAQAGRVVGADDPSAALDALEIIEHEASSTLAEMRSIVGTLRDARAAEDPEHADDAELTPLHGLADIDGFATATDAGPSVVVDIRNTDRVGPTIGAALYRITQEAITNARRHAVDATEVRVSIDGSGDEIQLSVDDDGRPQRSAHKSQEGLGQRGSRQGGFGQGGFGQGGFGLIGMQERAELLGGTLHAGPGHERGWHVDATIPFGATR